MFHSAKERLFWQRSKGFSLNRRGFSLLVFLEAPGLIVFAQQQTVGTERFYLEPDIVEGPETKAVLHQRRVFRNALDRVTLYEETVAHMLEVAVELILVEVLDPDNGTGETYILCVGSIQPPLAQQVAGITTLLTRSE